MRRAAYFALSGLAVLYMGACAAAFMLQRSLMYAPQPRHVTATESTMGLQVDGAQLVVTVRPSDSPRAVLYFGGNAEDVSQNLPSFSAAFPDHALYLLHYRGYGGSTGDSTEANNQRDAEALFDAVRGEHPEIVVIGRSLGTGIAVRLAVERPVSRLVLVTPYDSMAEIAASAMPYLPVR